MNQRWAEVLCVLAAGSIARLRGDRMSICSNLQRIEFDGSKGCVNSWEFSLFLILNSWELSIISLYISVVVVVFFQKRNGSIYYL